MLSTRLTALERQRMRALAAQLDGVPYTVKGPLLRASLEQMRASSRFSVGRTVVRPQAFRYPPWAA